MYLGKLCEIGDAESVYARPSHPYTRALLASIPDADPDTIDSQQGVQVPLLQGDLPSPANPPSGCRFRTRCPGARERCGREEPVMQMIQSDHYVACHFPVIDVV
jgi:peptide/nickel transport system ATP-binding protein